MTKTNSNDKYGGLLNKYMDDRHIDYRIKTEREKESQDKYGGLLDKAKPDDTILNDIPNVSNAYINDYMKKKEAEQEAITQKKKEEAEKADFYKRVERLANIDPHMAEVFIQTVGCK